MAKAAKLDLDAAATYLGGIPPGRWTPYGDVAVAAGRAATAGQAVAAWLMSKGDQVSNVHRVLTIDGEVSGGWVAAGPGVPQTREAVIETSRSEGVQFLGERADPAQRWRP
jgi:alkylated DNA nucleotide flippase Atl1